MAKDKVATSADRQGDLIAGLQGRVAGGGRSGDPNTANPKNPDLALKLLSLPIPAHIRAGEKVYRAVGAARRP